MTKNVHIIETTHGLYANLQNIISMVLHHHNLYPTAATLDIYNALKQAREEFYDRQNHTNNVDINGDIPDSHKVGTTYRIIQDDNGQDMVRQEICRKFTGR